MKCKQRLCLRATSVFLATWNFTVSAVLHFVSIWNITVNPHLGKWEEVCAQSGWYQRWYWCCWSCLSGGPWNTALLIVPPSSPTHPLISAYTFLVGKWFSILSMTVQFHIPVDFLISSPEALAAITYSFRLKSIFFNIKVSVLSKSAFSTCSFFWVWGVFFSSFILFHKTGLSLKA